MGTKTFNGILQLQKDIDKKREYVRYNLHRKIRKEGYMLKTEHRTIYAFFKNVDNLSESVLKLRDEFGYAIQTEMCN